ncbi:protein SCARECROW-like [Lotus japonicus]|uniref:protein SCARECROW-like n=1 Tax=Lotus japonicus TaxID=34305 RepID=UPI002589F47E|nr:protein SCARECROW-like [Lotus japonicus]
MMKLGFEVLHANPNIMIRPHMHETWDYPNIADHHLPPPPTPSNPPYPKPSSTENHCINFTQNNEVCDWVEHITKHLVEDIPDTTSDSNLLPNNLFPSQLSHNFNPRKSTCVYDPTSSSNNFNLIQTNTIIPVLDHNNHSNIAHDHELTLITLLMECAVAISVENLIEAHKMLLELTQVASPYKPSCAERVVAYFAKAMASRVMNSMLGVCSPLIDHRTIHSALQVFNNMSPFIKFAHFTSNQAILEAVNRCGSIHIIDLDIMQGLQWPPFFHILATRIEGPPEVRMTGMGSSMELLVETGKNLTNFARRLGISLKFNPVVTKFGEVDVSILKARPGETLAVHWLQHSLYDATGPDWKTLRLLEELEPRIITLVEQDVNHGGAFLDRFVGSLHYYSTLFDSLGACLHSDDDRRHSVEHGLLSREINNILAIGGPARSGEDKFRQWRSELARNCCFVQVPMSVNSMAQAQLILNMFSPALGYSLAQVDGTLRLGWKDTSLYTASAWTCGGGASR